MNFIIFSTADWDNPFWTNKQHTADRLAKRGHKVFYIESLGLRAPTAKSSDLGRILNRLKKSLSGAKKVEDNIWVYSPLVIPLHRFGVVKSINQIILKFAVRYFQWKLKLDAPVLWTYNPVVVELLESLDRSKIVYHSVDDLSASPGIDRDLIKSTEKKLFRSADLIFCTSQKIFNNAKEAAPEKTFYFPNVVDKEHFSKAKESQLRPRELENLKGPIIGFIGAISEYKVDYQQIKAAANSHPDWNFVMIGKMGEGQPNSKVDLKVENIHLIGPKDYLLLPQYLHFFDVCLIPAPLNDYTHAMFPMKFFEYMAAEKPIVSSRIDSLKDFEENYYAYDDNMERAIIEALNEGIPPKSRYQELVNANTWDKRLDKMLEQLNAK